KLLSRSTARSMNARAILAGTARPPAPPPPPKGAGGGNIYPPRPPERPRKKKKKTKKIITPGQERVPAPHNRPPLARASPARAPGLDRAADSCSAPSALA